MSVRKYARKHAMKLASALDPDGPELLIEFFGSGIMSEAADRIAALEAELAEAKALLREIHETARDESESIVDRIVMIQNMTEEVAR